MLISFILFFLSCNLFLYLFINSGELHPQLEGPDEEAVPRNVDKKIKFLQKFLQWLYAHTYICNI